MKDRIRIWLKNGFIFVIFSVLTIFIFSFLYKKSIGYYNYKEVVLDFYNASDFSDLNTKHISGFSEKIVTLNGFTLPKTWSPSLKEDTFLKGIEGRSISFTVPGKGSFQLNLIKSSEGMKYLLKNGTLSVIRTGYGSWSGFMNKFPDEKAALDFIFSSTAPEHLKENSFANNHPIGFYLFPLFPAWKNYQEKIKPLLIKRTMLASDNLIKYEGQNLFSFAEYSNDGAILFVGDKINGSVNAMVVLSRESGDGVGESLLDQLFKVLDTFPPEMLVK